MPIGRSSPPRSGFTLIEVTLSIVIGIVLIAGATLLYNQAKLGAGNARAKAKVIALQGLVEEMAVNAGGTYPLVASVYTAWVQRRPEDYDMSPWGGQAPMPDWGTTREPGFDGQDGLAAGNNYSSGGMAPGQAGSLQYVTLLPPSAYSTINDRASGATISVKGYWVIAVAPDGSYYWFSRGGE